MSRDKRGRLRRLKKIKAKSAKLAWRKGGIGILVWTEHLKSLRKLWVRRYLDPGTGDWKHVLDHWVCRGHTLGRGVLLGNGDLPEMPNKFWEETCINLRDMKFRRKDGPYDDADEANEEPIWESHRHGAPRVTDRDLWEDGMGVRQVKDWKNRRKGRPWRGDHWDTWATRGQGGIGAFGGQRGLDKQRRQISDTIEENLKIIRLSLPAQWAKEQLVAFFTPQGHPRYGRIVSINNLRRLRRVRLTTYGEPIVCRDYIRTPRLIYDERGDTVQGDPLWRVRVNMEGRVTGIAGITFPRTSNYRAPAVDGGEINFDAMTAKELTRDGVDRTTQRPTCEKPGRWPVQLRLRAYETINWGEVWDTFKIGLATPVDFGTRFRMIHGDLGTRSKRGEPGGCRLGCGCAVEKHIHIIECPRLQPLWNKLTNILESARGRPYRQRSQAILLGWTTEGGAIEKASTALFSMLLKIINIEWFKVILKNRAFDYAKVWKIFWGRARRQWNETAKDKEY